MSTERPTRRGFLQGKGIARELSGLVHRVDDPVAVASKRSFVVSVRRRAMACEFEVQLAAARDDDSMHHVFEALDLVEALESQLTIYRDDSEVTRVNQTASVGPVAVEPRLFGLIHFANRLHGETEGALDITSGPLSEVWGFMRREGRVPSDEQVEQARERVGMQYVHLDPAKQTIAFRRPGMAINFNSLGKGYALDRMAELFAVQDIDDILLQGGKSSVLARGDQPGSNERGWRVGVRHPLRNSERVAEIILQNKALSTSGAGTQFFIRRGKRYGHILDPRTGQPADGLYSTTVLAPSATEAEALSTAFYVMGPQKAAEYCAAHPEIAALLVAPGNREGDVRLIALGPDNNQWLRLADH